MIRISHLLNVLRAVARSALVAAVITAVPIAFAADTLRPEVGKPLQAAQELMKAKKYKEALAKVREADNVTGKTPYENFIVERMRGSIASATGDNDTAIKSFEETIASGRLSGAEQLKMIEALAGMYYRANDYAKTVQWATRHQKEGGKDPQIRTLLIQSQYLTGDCKSVNRELLAEVQADEKAGRTPSEERLQLLANCYLKEKDNAGYVATLERLVNFYAKKEYWVDLLSRIPRKPGYADRLALDLYRLKLATGNLTSSGDYMEMAQLALQDGFPAEGKKIVDQGFAAKVLGVGGEAERQNRLRDLAVKQVAEVQKQLAQRETEAAAEKGGSALVNVGFAYVNNGQFDKGIALMEQGIRKGGLKRPEDDKLHMGIAYLVAGQKAKAMQMFKTVGGTDGTADLARLWSVHARRA